MDWFVLLTPILLLPIVWLFVFVGCSLNTTLYPSDLVVRVVVPLAVLDSRPDPSEDFVVDVTVVSLGGAGFWTRPSDHMEVASVSPRPSGPVREFVFSIESTNPSEEAAEVEIFAAVRSNTTTADVLIGWRDGCRGVLRGETESRGFVTFQDLEPHPSIPGKFVFVRPECGFGARVGV